MTVSSITWSREENLQSLSNNPRTQLLIIGGGIHGAAMARLAALNNIESILLERGDYGAGTSSRSSKMAHGGLRYLENFDFEQVFEGIKAREELFADAQHICKPERFLIPVKKNDWWFRIKLGIGLFLYDLMVTNKSRKHTWIPRAELSYEGFNKNRTDLMGCFSYCDGIMNDSRLVIENIVHARELGSRCLNYVEVLSVTKAPNGKFEVIARDAITAKEYPLTADLVVNCAGPWAPFIGHKESEALKSKLRYSAGIHLIFNRPWNQPSLFLPMPGKSRYYFVWPHPGGTMVGTTEREVTEIPFEQFPTEGEVEEILERLKKDLPSAGLSRETLHYAFAGVRTLPIRDESKGTATLSRKHIWQDQAGVLTLLGGKFTTSSWTAFEGIRLAAKTLGSNTEMKSLSGVKYPGWATDTESAQLTQKLVAGGVSKETAARIVRRLGKRTDYLLEDSARLRQLSPRLLLGELELGTKVEQAMTIEDLLRRRTELEYMPGSGLNELNSIVQYLAASGQQSTSALEEEAEIFRERIGRLYKIMNIAESSSHHLAEAAA